MKKKRLRKSDIRELNQQLDCYNYEADKKDDVELIETEDLKLILINGETLFFYYEDKVIPTLKFLIQNNHLKKIIVDMGAVKFMASGADVMRPGIVEIDNTISKGDAVSIIDENNKKPLAIGIAMYDADEMQNLSNGRVIKNIHYIGDDIWNFKI